MTASQDRQSVPLRLRYSKRTNQGFRENLGDGVELVMMRIPAGRFVMGTPEEEDESLDRERPQHPVSVPEFFMGRYPVTQVQWRAVAGYEPVEQALNSDRAGFGLNFAEQKV